MGIAGPGNPSILEVHEDELAMAEQAKKDSGLSIYKPKRTTISD